MPRSWDCAVHWAVLGAGRPDLTGPVEAFLAAEGHPVPQLAGDRRRPRRTPALARGAALRGLFCGGTLADEAMTVAEAELGGIRSNIAHAPDAARSGPTCATTATSSSTSATTGSPGAAPTR